MDTGGVGDRSFNFMGDFLRSRVKRDGIAQTFTHLRIAICTYKPWGIADQSLRFCQYRLVQLVETAHDSAGQFQMRQLIVPHGNNRCLAEGDICSLADRIPQKPVIQFVDSPSFGFCLNGGIMAQRINGYEHREKDSQLSNFGNHRLNKNGRLLRINSCG
ncbi:hypothetical protein D3C74_393760 [compost metagenome]